MLTYQNNVALLDFMVSHSDVSRLAVWRRVKRTAILRVIHKKKMRKKY